MMGASQLRPARGRGPWRTGRWPQFARVLLNHALMDQMLDTVDLLAAVLKGGGQRSAVILSLLGAALTAAPAFAIDLSNGADVGGT